jgi:hypothetical protein
VAQHQAAGFSPLTNNIITDFDKKSSGTLNEGTDDPPLFAGGLFGRGSARYHIGIEATI